MDAELKAYLQAMEQRLATKADVDGLRTDMGALRTDVIGLRTDVGALRTEQDALRTDVIGLRTEQDALRTDVIGLRTEQGALRTDLHGVRTDLDEFRSTTAANFVAVRHEQQEQFDALRAEIRGVRQTVERAEERLDASIRSWKEESSLALAGIERLRGRVGHLTKRVRWLERPKP